MQRWSQSCGTSRIGRADLDQKPPEQPFDQKIQAFNGTTSALEFRRDVMQAAKKLKWPTSEQRMVELVRMVSAFKRELQFFRLEFEASQALKEGLYSISHQMYLNYFAHDADGQLHHEWFSQAQEIDQYLRRYDEVVRKAETDWVELSRCQAERDGSDWI